MPIFLLNYDVWTAYLSSLGPKPGIDSLIVASTKSTAIAFDRSNIVGFLRSYSLLVSYPLDLAIAQELYLVPKEID